MVQLIFLGMILIALGAKLQPKKDKRFKTGFRDNEAESSLGNALSVIGFLVVIIGLFDVMRHDPEQTPDTSSNVSASDGSRHPPIEDVEARPLQSTSPPVETLRDSVEVREMQSLLRALGYDPGLIDGQIGPKTSNALKQYADAMSISVSNVSVASLRQAHEEKMKGSVELLETPTPVISNPSHEMPKSSDQIVQYLLNAKSVLADNSSGLGVRDRALEAYFSVLRIDPKNLEAAIGVRNIAEVLAKEGIQDLDIGNVSSARAKIHRARLLAPESITVQDAVNALRRADMLN